MRIIKIIKKTQIKNKTKTLLHKIHIKLQPEIIRKTSNLESKIKLQPRKRKMMRKDYHFLQGYFRII
jgi:hypothetical protein